MPIVIIKVGIMQGLKKDYHLQCSAKLCSLSAWEKEATQVVIIQTILEVCSVRTSDKIAYYTFIKYCLSRALPYKQLVNCLLD